MSQKVTDPNEKWSLYMSGWRDGSERLSPDRSSFVSSLSEDQQNTYELGFHAGTSAHLHAHEYAVRRFGFKAVLTQDDLK